VQLLCVSSAVIIIIIIIIQGLIVVEMMAYNSLIIGLLRGNVKTDQLQPSNSPD